MEVDLLGTTLGSPRELAALLRAVDSQAWQPVVDSVQPLAEVADAHARAEGGEQFGSSC